MSGRQQDRGRGGSRGGRGGDRDHRGDFAHRPRGGGGGGRGEGYGQRQSEAGRGRGGFGRGGRGGPTEIEVFSHGDGAPAKENIQVQNVENETFKKTLAKTAPGSKNLEREDAPPPRPGYGTRGRPVLLWANYFELASPGGLLLHRYSIEILPEQGRTPTGKKVKRIIELLLEENFRNLQHTIATDYKSNLICASDLDIKDGHFSVHYRAEGEDEPAVRASTYRLRLQKTGTLRVSELVDYLTSTTASALLGSKEEIVQALNIVMGHHPKTNQTIFSVGANKHFEVNASRSEKMDLGAGLTAVRGFLFSVRAATSRILVNVHVKHTTCYNDGPLGLLMTTYLSANGRNMIKLQNFLKKVRIEVTHIVKKNRSGGTIPRIKTISGLAMPGDGQGLEHPPVVPKFAAGAKEVKFFLASNTTPSGSSTQGPAGSGGKKKGKKPAKAGPEPPAEGYISIFDFFKRTYNINVADPSIPVINVGTRQNPSYLPVDVCQVLPGQASQTKLTPNQTQQMIRFAVRRPAQNARSIVTNGARLLGVVPEMNDTLTSFGMNVNPRLIVVPGRVLTVPNVNYRGGRIPPSNGGWNMRNIKFSESATLPTWTYLNISMRDLRRLMERDEEFTEPIKSFRAKLAEVGIDPKSYVPGFRICSDAVNVENDVDVTIGNFFANPARPAPTLLFVILPYVDTAIYNRVKYVCDIKRGMLNVCVIGSKFAKERNDQYFANVALKFNLKLGGRNQSLDVSKLGVIGERKTMVVGLDVTHPSPGSASNAPSVAGIVASIDSQLGQWPADIRIQPTARQEMVADLDVLLTSRLKLWHKINKGYPENIIVYRDGVSEGQYHLVLEQELPLLRKSCTELYPASDTKKGLPRISIIIVGKRHNTRFYPTKQEDADRSSNPVNGTVVDRGVTETRHWDFFLQAHTALQGTARPAHYYIALDEIFRARKAVPPFENAADSLEDLTHNMCYLFGRATRAVSICPAAYYADLVCERARCYLSGLFDPTTPEGSSVGTTAGGGAVLSANEVRVHDNVKDRMFYI